MFASHSFVFPRLLLSAGNVRAAQPSQKPIHTRSLRDGEGAKKDNREANHWYLMALRILSFV